MHTFAQASVLAYVCARVCMCAYERVLCACMRACMRHAYVRACVHVWGTSVYVRMGVFVCLFMCACICVHACVSACDRACERLAFVRVQCIYFPAASLVAG